MNDNLEQKIRNGKMTRRDFNNLLVKGIGVGAVGGAVATLEKCSTTTGPEPPPPTEYDHDFLIEKLQDMETGAEIAGATYTITINGQTYNGTVGQKLTLPKTNKKIELCKVVINAPGYYQRTYNSGEVTTGTKIAPTLVNVMFPLADYLTFWPTGHTYGWSSRTMNVTFNQGLGDRLDFVAAIKQPINNDPEGKDFLHYSRVHNWNEYFLNDIRFSNGTHVIDTTIPPVGDWWAFLDSSSGGVSTAAYSSNGTDIIAIKELINPGTGSGQVIRDTKLALLRVPGIADFPQVKQWMILKFNRPATADYVFGLGGESQNGFDGRSLSTPTSNIYALGSAVNFELIEKINEHKRTDPSPDYIPGRHRLLPGDRIAPHIISYVLQALRS
jgi:hypothetical protein